MEGPAKLHEISKLTNQTQCLTLVEPHTLQVRQGNVTIFENEHAIVNTDDTEKIDTKTRLSKSSSDEEQNEITTGVRDYLQVKIKDDCSNCDKFDGGNFEQVHVNLRVSSDEKNHGPEPNVESESNSKVTEHIKAGKKKEAKRLSLQFLFPSLKRSQSADCENTTLCNHGNLCQEKTCDHSEEARRVHKTYSADAAVMNTDVLPIDPQEFMRNKQKSSIAKNMRKKFQKLKRRNTDSLLGVAKTTARGVTTKITRADAAQWATTFDSLLTDKNGIEMFRAFLKSEFSEENIEFWIACEEFKTVRTNKLVPTAHKIYTSFIAINSPKQVNLDSKTRLETVTHLENPTRDLFKPAQKRIQFLMENDSYKRFLDSEEYRLLLRRHSSEDGI